MRVRALAGVAAVAIGAAPIAGCGSSSPGTGSGSSGGASTSPSGAAGTRAPYCTALSNLESSIKALPGTEVVKHGTSALESAFSQVKQNTEAVVEATKSEFPTQSAALKSSVDTLTSTVEQIAHAPTGALIAQLPGQVSAVATQAKNLQNAASSKCK